MKEELEQYTPQIKLALRTAISMVLCTWIAIFLQLPNPFWATITALMMSTENVGASFEKGVLRILGTLMGVILGFLITYLFVQTPILFILAYFVVISLLSYLTVKTKYPYAAIVTILTLTIVIIYGRLYPDSAFFSIVIWRVLEIVLGIVVSCLVAVFIFPTKANQVIWHHILDIQSCCEDLMLTALDPKQTNTTTINDINTSVAHALAQCVHSKKMLYFSKKEYGHKIYDDATIEHLVISYQRLLHSIKFLSIRLSKNRMAGYRQDLSCFQSLYVALHQDIKSLRQYILSHGKVPLSTHHTETLLATPSQIHQTHLSLIYHAYHDILQSIKRITQDASLQTTTPPVTPLYAKKIIKQLIIFFNDTDLLKFGIKVGLSTSLTLVAWLYTHWPGGALGIISAWSISKQNLYDSNTRAIQRLYGTLLGGGFSLLYLHFFTDNIWTMLCALFIGVFSFSFYASWKQVNNSYLGIQANLTLTMAIVATLAPDISIAPPLERLGGIMMGGIIALLISRLIWPVHPKHMLRDSIHATMKHLAELLQQTWLRQKHSPFTTTYFITKRRYISQQLSAIAHLLPCLDDATQKQHDVRSANHIYPIASIVLLINYRAEYHEICHMLSPYVENITDLLERIHQQFYDILNMLAQRHVSKEKSQQQLEDLKKILHRFTAAYTRYFSVLDNVQSCIVLAIYLHRLLEAIQVYCDIA